MRQDVVGAVFVATICGIVVLATYRPEKNESKVRIFVTLGASMLFAFALSFAILYMFFANSRAAAEAAIIKSPPDF
jgi:uncharacterized membrane protein